jgi:deazaflavin-dependent oxidoreductase (nitroreductase family)
MALQGVYAPGSSDWARRQADRFVESRGTQGATLGGRPIVVLTSLGARTGKLRRTALMRVEDDGRYAAVASLGGAPRNPRWVANLRAHPHVELQDGAVTRDYVAREVDGTERQGWWRRAVEAYPPYEQYQAKTKRRIPVFVLEPS